MKVTLYSSSFNTAIGCIYYIWGNYFQDDMQKTGAAVNQEIKIYFLSNTPDSYNSFIERLGGIKAPEYKIADKSSRTVESEVKAYLEKKLKDFSMVPVFLFSSAIKQKVWEAAMKIPYGKVASYKELAESAGFSGAWRAAGTALGKNPIMLVIPCHRVIKSDGSIGHFGGGEKVKEFLLGLEQPDRDE